MNGGNRIHDKYFSTLKALYHGISVLCTIMLMQLTVELDFGHIMVKGSQKILTFFESVAGINVYILTFCFGSCRSQILLVGTFLVCFLLLINVIALQLCRLSHYLGWWWFDCTCNIIKRKLIMFLFPKFWIYLTLIF